MRGCGARIPTQPQPFRKPLISFAIPAQDRVAYQLRVPVLGTRSNASNSLAAAAGLAFAASLAFAQLARQPFMVGGGVTGWLIEMQSKLPRLNAADMLALHGNPPRFGASPGETDDGDR